MTPDAISRMISIHTPREGGDPVASAIPPAARTISIHTPREGGDLTQAVY